MKKKTNSKKALFERYDVLGDLHFASAADRELALLACVWAGQVLTTGWERREGSYRPPLVVIIGPAGSGKTRLAAKLQHLAGTRVNLQTCVGEEALSDAASTGEPVVVFDDVAGDAVDWPLLMRWIESPFWKTRRLRENAQTFPLHCVTVLTGLSFDVPKEMRAAAVVICLKSGAEG